MDRQQHRIRFIAQELALSQRAGRHHANHLTFDDAFARGRGHLLANRD